MAKNLVLKEFIKSGTLTIPAGVKRARLCLLGENHKFFSAGELSVQAIGLDGLARSWGRNQLGALGVGDGLPKSSPTAVSGSKMWTAFSARGDSGAGIDNMGLGWAWGLNTNGSLGDGSAAVSKSSPVAISGGIRFLQIGNGSTNMVGLDSNNVAWAWGSNTLGQLGDGTIAHKSSPILVSGNLKFQSVGAAGDGASGTPRFCAGLDFDGHIWTWGANTSGPLGDGTTAHKSSPVQVSGNLTFKQMALGSEHMCAIDTDGNAWCWGENAGGKLGDGTAVDKSSPVQVQGNVKFTRIAAGSSNTAAIDESGNVWAWGNNTFGQIGDGTVVSKSSPVQVQGNLKFNGVTVGDSHMAGVDFDAKMWAWGRGLDGALGDGTIVDKSSPVAVSGNITWHSNYDRTASILDIDVDPGTTYSILFSSMTVMFGNISVGQVFGSSMRKLIVGYLQ